MKSLYEKAKLATLRKVIIFETDARGNLTRFDCDGLEALGYSEEDFSKGLNIKDLFALQHLDQIVRHINAIQKGWPAHGGEYTLIRKDGSPLEIYMCCSAVMRNNWVVGMRAVCVALDKVEETQETQKEVQHKDKKLQKELFALRKENDELRRQVAEQSKALKASQDKERLQNAMLESCPVGISTIRDNKIEWANSAWMKIYGFESDAERKESAEKPLWGSREFERAAQTVLSGSATDESTDVWTKQKRTDGSVFDAHLALATLKAPESRRSSLLVTATDVSERVSRDRAIRRSEADLRAALDVVPYAFFVLDIESGKVTYINRKMCEIFDDPNVEDLKANLGSLVTGEGPLSPHVRPEDRIVLCERYRGLVQHEEAIEDLQFQWQHDSGKTQWLSLSAVTTVSDNRASMLCFVRDAAVHRHLEKIVSRDERLLLHIVEAANDIIYITDEKGVFTYVNPSVTPISGYSEEEFIGKHFGEFIAPANRKAVEKFYSIQFVKRIPNTYYEFPMITKHGETIWLGQHVQLLAENDRIVGFQAICRDITDRRKAEDSLREGQERFRQLAESVDDMFMLIRPGKPSSFIYVSPAYERLTGRNLNEIYEKPTEWLLLVHEEDRGRVQSLFDSFVKNRDDFNSEFRIVKPDGEVRWIWATGGTIKDSDGNVYRLAITARDVTQRKLDEQRLEHLVQEIKDFAYIVSHDFRAPLINIKGFSRELELAVETIKPAVKSGIPQLNDRQKSQVLDALEEDLPEALEFINSSVSKMDNLINAILDMSRLERHELRPEPLDMNLLMEDVLKALSFQLTEADASVSIGELPETVADRLCMEQIMTNLLSNAIKFRAPGRPQKITVSGVRFPDETVFVMRDQGRGIEHAYLSQIFQIFQRGTSQDVPGEGIGLAYVRALVRRHGGRIWCESEIGKGSTFNFTVSNRFA